MDFSLSNVKDLLGKQFVCNVTGKEQNIKVDLRALTERNGTQLTDDAKIDLLVSARTKLQEAGLNATIRLSSRTANGGWTNWPHMWVNKTARVDPSVEMAELKQQLAAIQSLLQEKVGVMQDTVETTTETTNTETPSEEEHF